MIDLDILYCKFISLLSTYAQKKLWGLDCNLDSTFNTALILYNQIKMYESIPECEFSTEHVHSLFTLQNRTQAHPLASFCNQCE